MVAIEIDKRVKVKISNHPLRRLRKNKCKNLRYAPVTDDVRENTRTIPTSVRRYNNS